MSLTTEMISYGPARPARPEREFTGYLAYPTRAQTPLPAVIVIQEVWGVDQHIQDVTRRIASAGYAALAPDLYARAGQRPEPLRDERMSELKRLVEALPLGALLQADKREAALEAQPEPLRTRLRESLQAFFSALGNSEAHLLPLLAASKYFREELPATRGGKIGSVGFCMGGGLSALLACRDPQLSAAVIFYGSSPPAEQIPSIQCPVLGLYAEQDPRINAGLPAFGAAMEQHGKRLSQHIYPGAAHAFFNDTRPAYHVQAARDAFVRALAFFREHLA